MAVITLVSSGTPVSTTSTLEPTVRPNPLKNEWKSGTDQTPQEAKQTTNADWRVLRQLPVTLALFGPDIVQKGGKVQGFGSSFK